MKKLLSAFFSLFVWVFAGLLVSPHMSNSMATWFGFGCFAIVAALTFPRGSKVK